MGEGDEREREATRERMRGRERDLEAQHQALRKSEGVKVGGGAQRERSINQ